MSSNRAYLSYEYLIGVNFSTAITKSKDYTRALVGFPVSLQLPQSLHFHVDSFCLLFFKMLFSKGLRDGSQLRVIAALSEAASSIPSNHICL